MMMKIYDRGSNSHVLSLKIKERKIEKMAEVGVFHGKNVKYVLKDCHDILKEYWAIDKYNNVWEKGAARGRGYVKKDDSEWHEIYKRVCRFIPFYPQLHILKMTSAEASGLFPKKFFPEGYFDFIYIDADHSYNGIKEDIKIWTPLVKKGGLIGGHDYGRVRWPGIKLVVDEKFGEENVTLYEKQSIWLVNL